MIEAPVLTVSAATAYATPTRLADAPALWVVDDFLDDPTMDALLGLFGDAPFVEGNADHFGVDHAGFAAEVPADAHPLLEAVMTRVEAAVGIRSSQVATFRFRYYLEGEGHRPHVDAYTYDDTRLAISTLITLVQPEAGGETRFLDARPSPLAVEQRRGRLIAWTSTLPGGDDDPASRHEGAAVVRGAKGVLLSFLYLPAAALDGKLEMRGV